MVNTNQLCREDKKGGEGGRKEKEGKEGEG